MSQAGSYVYNLFFLGNDAYTFMVESLKIFAQVSHVPVVCFRPREIFSMLGCSFFSLSFVLLGRSLLSLIFLVFLLPSCTLECLLVYAYVHAAVFSPFLSLACPPSHSLEINICVNLTHNRSKSVHLCQFDAVHFRCICIHQECTISLFPSFSVVSSILFLNNLPSLPSCPSRIPIPQSYIKAIPPAGCVKMFVRVSYAVSLFSLTFKRT
jgi:hypothetical protein